MPYSKPLTVSRSNVELICRSVLFEGQFLDSPDYHIWSDYHGRVMEAGETCLGITLPRSREVRNEFFRQAYFVLGEEAAMRMLSTYRMDALGLEIILYFPGVSLAAGVPQVVPS